MDVFVRALKLSLRVARTEPFVSLLDQNCNDPFFDQTLLDQPDSVLEAIIRDRLETLYHPCCTARMAPLSEGGVVDSKLRVHGIEGLRIADASVFPMIVSGHTVRLVSSKCGY